MSEMNERNLGCCPPPHQCAHHGTVTMGDWMQYINTYIDVRARQIYDKLKGLIPGGGGEVNRIIAGDNVTVSPSSGKGDVTISVEVEDKIKDNILMKDSSTGKVYKVFIKDNVICTDEIAEN